MKTVMKKMFSLLLVAVLMVGMLPFQAFAADIECTACGKTHAEDAACCTTCKQPGHDEADAHCSVCSWYVGHSDLCTSGCDKSGTCAWEKTHNSDCLSLAVCDHCDATQDHFTANCPNFCTQCGQDNHDESEAHCSSCKYYVGHSESCATLKCDHGCGKLKHEGPCCTTCQQNGHLATACTNVCEICKDNGLTVVKNPSHVHCAICKELNGGHTDSCDNNPYKEKTCAKCNATYTDAVGHVCCDRCKEGHTTANCPYCVTCWAKGDKVKAHSTAAHCDKCDTINGHKGTCPNYTYAQNGSSKLHVWANLVTGDVRRETILLDTITGLNSSDLIYQVVTNNKAHLMSKFPAGYDWSGHLYFEQDSKTVLDVYSKMTVGAEDDVFINLYTDEKLVVARVHTAKAYTVDRTVNISGFKVGETVTSADVLKAVKKFYAVNSLKMYTPNEWEQVVLGKSGTTTPNYKVHGGDNVIDVYISGYAVNSNGAVADSSNPKTGDAIFTPMIVLGASAACLAALFFLNKKRAY